MRPLDDFLPVYEFSERHSLAIDAPAARIDEAFRAVSISDIPVARALWWIRRLGRPYGDSTKPFVGGELPGVVLEDVPEEGIVLGLTGQFWRLLGGERDPHAPSHRRRVPRVCARRHVQGGHRLPRRPGVALDRDARARRRSGVTHGSSAATGSSFGPFSGLIRILLLRAARRESEAVGMKLVTFDNDRVGYVDGDEIVVLDVPSMRELFEDGGADETGERVSLAETRAPRADRPEEVLPHGRELPRARGGVEAGRLVARDRAVDRLLPERRRDRRAGRAGRLPGAPDRGARLRARARGRDQAGRASGSRPRRRASTSAAT